MNPTRRTLLASLLSLPVAARFRPVAAAPIFRTITPPAGPWSFVAFVLEGDSYRMYAAGDDGKGDHWTRTETLPAGDDACEWMPASPDAHAFMTAETPLPPEPSEFHAGSFFYDE